MRMVSDGQMAQLVTDIAAFYGEASGLGIDALIRKIPAGATDDDERETVIAALRCSNIYPATKADVERLGPRAVVISGGTVKRLFRVFCEVPETAIAERMRLEHGGVDYRIAVVVKHPEDAPLYYELFIEDEGVAA
jgi:hypothetical protein